MTVTKPIAISAGDPAGVGPEIVVRVLAEEQDASATIVYGDAALLSCLFESYGGEPRRIRRLRHDEPLELAAGAIGLVDTGGVPFEVVAQRAASKEGGQAQLRALEWATDSVRRGRASALVTGPVSKTAVTLAGYSFSGQTEYLARQVGIQDDDVTMLFLGPNLRVALVTTHLSVRSVPDQITEPRIVRSARHLAQALLALGSRGSSSPTMAIAGLNPHAGEGGLFGSEERDIVIPAIRLLSEVAPFAAGQVVLKGLLPSETAFRLAHHGALDGVVAMMHDHATIASKLLDWTEAVNVTWGLPFVRTSVDHGVAYDIAGKGQADISGMRAALSMARRLTAAREIET